ncbi:MAG: UDP-N-acetylmuramoyl-L-alanyl-D-glutamate--2,6-diaminopimelate ligase [Planctomycetes bacterium]|nr:UDP-N-acetylmuramoyl-L-alanyl-D-glutamate--2,6-diaminopimelate ligase [Planctomycetota bacterium]
MVRTLSWLLSGLDGCRLEGPGDVGIDRVVLDSRVVKPGDVFAALPGTHADGVTFVPEAIRRGASALLLGEGVEVQTDLPRLRSPYPRADAARAAHRLAGDPGQHLELVAVTGTNGKTTTAWLLKELLANAPGRFGCIGTVANTFSGTSRTATQTTPDSGALAGLLAEMHAARVPGAAIEVSSHALHQDRVAGVKFEGAVLTNLTRDHLDYHGSMDDYLAAKLRLGDHLAPGAPWVYPADDPRVAEAISGRDGAVSYGTSASADLRIVDAALLPGGARIMVRWRGKELTFRSPLVGSFNVDNVAAALTLALARGRAVNDLRTRLLRFRGVPGRMQRVAAPGGPTGLVDYAHTPDAIEKVLAACRSFAAGRVIVVVGAGGDRDRGKRPLMGRAAQRGADVVILTSDNPRTEDAGRILEDIASGLTPPAGGVFCEPDRATAIRRAVAHAAPSDLVAVLGKGHETYQEIDGVRHPFSDVRELEHALTEVTAGG